MAGNVGRPPKPSALKLITARPLGATPSHYLAGDPPEHLNDDAKAEWRRLGPMLESRGLISKEEGAAFALYCQAYGRWQQAERRITELAIDGDDGLIVKAPSGYPIQNPYLAIANKAMEQCYQYLQQFGLSPSARSRVMADGQPNLFDSESAKRYFGNS